MYEYLFTCNEPEGTKIRYVKPLEQRDIPRVFKHLSNSLAVRGRQLSAELALSEFKRLDKLYWTVDDVGLLIANKAGDCHIFFWDKRLRGREGLCKAMANVVMEIFDRDSVWTSIPDTERAVIAFAKRVGFKEEKHEDSLITLRLGRTYGS